MGSNISGVNLARTTTVMVPTVKHGGGNMLIWGSMTANGVRAFAFIKCKTLSVSLYTQILNEDGCQSQLAQ